MAKTDKLAESPPTFDGEKTTVPHSEERPGSDDDTTSKSTSTRNETGVRRIFWKVYDVIAWTPPRCRWDPAAPPQFSMFLNVIFGFAGAFTVRIQMERR